MQVENNLEQMPFGDVPNGALAFTRVGNGVALGIFATPDEERRPVFLLNPTPSAAEPAVAGARLLLANFANDTCFVAANAVLRIDPTSATVDLRDYPPIGAVVHSPDGLVIVALDDDRQRGRIGYHLGTHALVRPDLGAALFYARWKIVVPNGPRDESILFEFGRAGGEP